MLRRTSILLLATVGVATGLAQESADQGPAPVESLRAEATVERTLFSPSQPALVRFTLFNPTSEPIEIPVLQAGNSPGAITLPRALIIGTPEQPALFISHEGQKPVAVRGESHLSSDDAMGILRLAPRASVGAEVDLRRMHRLMRYSGSYRVEWQPFGGRVGPASVSFRIEAEKEAVLVTDYGKVTFSLQYDKAPHNVENFLELVRERFYDGKNIHRVIPTFIVQGGSPDGTGTGIRPDGKLVAAEFHDVPFDLGTLAMARKPSDPDSASCQFFISLGRLPALDGKYTVIGQARDEESLRTLRQIAELPTAEDGRPLRPLIIRFFTLVDAEADEVRHAVSP
jgi:peptidyl-prolyl cis-trans isomerase B (cyclophilin B)